MPIGQKRSLLFHSPRPRKKRTHSTTQIISRMPRFRATVGRRSPATPRKWRKRAPGSPRNWHYPAISKTSSSLPRFGTTGASRTRHSRDACATRKGPIGTISPKRPMDAGPKSIVTNISTEAKPARHFVMSSPAHWALRDPAKLRAQHPALLGPWSDALTKLGKAPGLQELLPVPPSLIQRVIDCSPEAFDLLVYLIASHHGKVRVALHAAPKDQAYYDRDGRGLPIRGIREGDRLQAIVLAPGGPPVPEVTLTLSPAALGLSEKTGISWRERSLGVVGRHGPAGLAFLEAILRAADVRASRLPTNDPLLTPEATS